MSTASKASGRAARREWAFLLDSHVLLWLNSDPGRIAPAVINELDSAESVFFSAASAWELSIKQSLGKLQITGSISAFAAEAGLLELPVTARYAEAAAQLPMHHRDPFDRLLVAQAMVEGLILMTADRRLSNYDVRTLQV